MTKLEWHDFGLKKASKNSIRHPCLNRYHFYGSQILFSNYNFKGLEFIISISACFLNKRFKSHFGFRSLPLALSNEWFVTTVFVEQLVDPFPVLWGCRIRTYVWCSGLPTILVSPWLMKCHYIFLLLE